MDNSNTYTHGKTAVGNYYYWVNETTSNGCVGPDTMVTLSINPLPNITPAVSDPSVCVGTNAIITVNNSEIGTTYQLRRDSDNANVGAAVPGNGAAITFTVNPASTITYNVLAQITATGCPAELTDKAIVTVHPLATITTQPQNRTICESNNTTFTITAAGPGLTYRWQVDQGSGWVDLNNNATYNGVTTSSLAVSNVTTGMNTYKYRVVLTTTGGCPRNSNAGILTVNPSPLDKNALAIDPFLCYNTGTVIRIENAQDGVSYTINNGVNPAQTQNQVGSSDLNFNTGPFTPASLTTYTYTITASALGCTRVLNDTPGVTVNANVILNAISHSDICQDGQIDLPDAPASGGSTGAAGFSYAWTGTDITGTITTKDPAPFNPVLSGTHNINLLVTDANFRNVVSTDNTTCTASRNMSFEVNPVPLNKSVSPQSTPICYNTPTNIQILASQNGIKYTVYRKADDTLLGSVDGNGGLVSVPTGNLTATTQYYVIASNIVTSCVFRLSDEPTVIVNPRFQQAQLQSSQSICVNSGTTINVKMTGGVSPYTLVYSDGVTNFTINNYTSEQAINTGLLAASVTYNVVSVTGCQWMSG